MFMDFVDIMKKEVEMSLIGEIKFFIGLQVQQLDGSIFICQTKYIKKVLKTLNMEDYKPIGTPMVTGCKLSKEDDSPTVSEKKYRSMIGKLHYIVHSRMNITHAAGLVARFQKEPKESHMVVVKRIFWYLKGTIDYGLWYPYKGDFTLDVFTDVDWESNVDDRKSTTGGDFLLGGRLVA